MIATPLTLEQQLEAFRDRMLNLLRRAGDQSRCSGCGATIYFVFHKHTNKHAPYDPDGTSHFATCPKSASFRKGGLTDGSAL